MHKFWRVVFDQSNSGGGASNKVWIDEISFSDHIGVDLSVGGTPSASSESSATFAVAGAFDKTGSTDGWSSATGQWPAWVAYEHTSPVSPAFCVIQFPDTGAASGSLAHPDYTHIEWSDDGVAWTRSRNYGISGNMSTGSTVRLLIHPVNFGLLLSPILSVGLLSEQETAGAPKAIAFGAELLTRDIWQGGAHAISGTVTIENIPGSRMVRLHNKHTGVVVAEKWSESNGSFSFENIDGTQEYYVTAFDHQRVYNAQISDMVLA